MPNKPVLAAGIALMLGCMASLTMAAGVVTTGHDPGVSVDSMADLAKAVGHVRPDSEAKESAVTRSYTVTARADGNPFYTRTVLVDSTGLVYQVTADGVASRSAQADAFKVSVPSAWPLVFTVDLRKTLGSQLAEAHATYRVDVPEGGVASATLTKNLSVTIERSYDQVVLR